MVPNVVGVGLVSKEFNHLAAILHVYARGLNFMKYFFFLSFLEKEDGNTFTLLIIFIHSEKSSKRAKKHYDPQSAGINLQSPQSDSTPWTLTLPL